MADVQVQTQSEGQCACGAPESAHIATYNEIMSGQSDFVIKRAFAGWECPSLRHRSWLIML